MLRTMLLLALALPLLLNGCTTTSPTGKSASYHLQMGAMHLGERNYTAALQELLEAEKLDDENPELLYNLGLAYLGKRRPDLAEPKFLKAINLKPNYSTARNGLGVTYMELKRWDQAIQQFKLVKDDLLYEQHDSAVVNLGLAYLGKGDYDKALDELNDVRAANPRNPVVRVAIGRVLAAQGKTDQSIAEFRKALDYYPDYPMAHYHLGLGLMKSDLVAARHAFKEVVRLAPDAEIGRSAQEYLELLK